jgi:hypothetical protein
MPVEPADPATGARWSCRASSRTRPATATRCGTTAASSCRSSSATSGAISSRSPSTSSSRSSTRAGHRSPAAGFGRSRWDWPVPQSRRTRAAKRTLDAVIADLIAERRRDGERRDLLARLVRQAEADGVTDDAHLTATFEMWFGADQLYALFAWTLDIPRLTYTRQILKESMRWGSDRPEPVVHPPRPPPLARVAPVRPRPVGRRRLPAAGDLLLPVLRRAVRVPREQARDEGGDADPRHPGPALVVPPGRRRARADREVGDRAQARRAHEAACPRLRPTRRLRQASAGRRCSAGRGTRRRAS